MTLISLPVAGLNALLWAGLLVFAGVAILLIANEVLFTVHLPKGVPLIREPPGATRFSLKTRLAYYTDCRALFREAYDNVCCEILLPHGMILTLAYSTQRRARPSSFLALASGQSSSFPPVPCAGLWPNPKAFSVSLRLSWRSTRLFTA